MSSKISNPEDSNTKTKTDDITSRRRSLASLPTSIQDQLDELMPIEATVLGNDPKLSSQKTTRIL